MKTDNNFIVVITLLYNRSSKTKWNS